MRNRIVGLIAVFMFVNTLGILPSSGIGVLDSIRPTPVAAQYNWQVEQWRSTVQAACGGETGCIERIMWLIACESGGVEYIQSNQINPGTGTYDYGLLQISTIWGDVAYADGVTQIYWTAAHLGSVWWAC